MMKIKEMVEQHEKELAEKSKKPAKATTIKQDMERKQDIKDLVSNLTSSEREIFKQELAKKKARDNYLEYLKYVYPNFIITKFHAFIGKLCDEVVKKIERGERPKILLSVPPRHGKSFETTETLPSWFIGRNPDKHCILTAYNAELAETFEDNNRKLTREFGKDIFDIEISSSQDNKTKYAIKDHDGFVMGVGIEGGITGNGGELIIVDDPYKNSNQANSPTEREKIERTFRDSVITRLQGKGNALIVIHTRWHEDDLIGKLCKESGWYVINIPAVCDGQDPYLGRKIGQTLCPELGFDTEWAESTKQNVGLKVWEALYQGHPSIDGGEIFKRDTIKYYTKQTRPLSFDEITMSCDLSFGGQKQSNDPCAIQVWGRLGANHYLLYRNKKRMTFVEMCEKIKNVITLYPQTKRKIVEKKANGQAVIDTLNGELGGFIPFDPKGDSKVGRANSVSYLFESGNVYLPDKSIDGTIDEMVEEMMKFPNSEHDDEVDAMTQYLITSENRSGGRVLTDSYYTSLSKAFRGLKV